MMHCRAAWLVVLVSVGCAYHAPTAPSLPPIVIVEVFDSRPPPPVQPPLPPPYPPPSSPPPSFPPPPPPSDELHAAFECVYGLHGTPTTCEAVAVSAGVALPTSAITNVQWNFGDGSTGSGVTVDHTYAAKGTYLIVITMTATIPSNPPRSETTTRVPFQIRIL